jgi:hypothetical protein
MLELRLLAILSPGSWQQQATVEVRQSELQGQPFAGPSPAPFILVSRAQLLPSAVPKLSVVASEQLAVAAQPSVGSELRATIQALPDAVEVEQEQPWQHQLPSGAQLAGLRTLISSRRMHFHQQVRNE